MPYVDIVPGDATIYPELDTAPTLPAAGGKFQDDRWGTWIYRVSDATNAPNGAATNSGSSHSPFNANGLRFYLSMNLTGGGDAHIIEISGTPPDDLTLTDLGLIGTTPGGYQIGHDGASWDWADPDTLYALSGARLYQLYRITVPSMTKTLLHDFTADIPAANGYTSPRLMLHPSNRYIGAFMGTTGGQDLYDYIIVWDQIADQTVATFHTETRLGAGVFLHGCLWDNSGEWVIMSSFDAGEKNYVWHWRSDTLSDLITSPGSPDIFFGHFSPGWNFAIAPTANGNNDPDWTWRQAASMHKYTSLGTLPRKNGAKDWYDDSHSTRVLPPHSNNQAGPIYVQSRLSPTYTWQATVGHANVYEVPNFYPSGIVNQPPDTCYYFGSVVPLTTQIPTAANQWWYDSVANKVYLRTVDNADLTVGTNALKAFVFDYRCFTQAIYSVEYLNGSLTWRRWCHTYSHLQDTADYWAGSGAEASPDGRFVIFNSRWGGGSRIDTFLMVPTNPPSVAVEPIALRRTGAFG